MPKVSICIPAYNNAEGVKRLLDSILIQTFTDYEILISDDSSNDQIQDLIASYPEGTISYRRNRLSLGAAANWNRCIQRARGEFIKLMHHDDWFSDCNSLETFVNLLEQNPKAVLAFSGTYQVRGDESFARHISEEDAKLIEIDYRNLFLGNTIGAPSAVIHRRTTHVYDERLSWLVDVDFYISLLKEYKQFAYTTEPLISIGLSENQMTERCIQDRDRNIFEYGYLFDKHHLIMGKVYCQKLVRILLEFRAGYTVARSHGISIVLFYREYIRKFCSKVVCKCKLIFSGKAHQGE